MNNQAVVAALVVFNVLLLILALVAWRLLRSEPKAAEQQKLERKKPSRAAARAEAKADAEIDLRDSSASTGAAGSDKARAEKLPVPAALRGPAGNDDASGDFRVDALDDTATDSRRRFVPGGVPVSDGSVPDFTLSMAHLFTADNGVLNRTRNNSAQPITLSIQAGPRPVTPLLERVVEALTNIGLEPSQTRPLVHSFSDAAGRSARVRLAHSPAHGDLIEIEIEPSISPSAMASVMSLLSDLEFDPADVMTSPGRQF